MTVVGVSSYFEPASWGAWSIEAVVLPRWYVDLLQQAGARVVILPPDPDPEALDRLDGLVLVGGADVDSRLYGEEPHVTADAPRETRDASELALYRRARDLEMPVLGICRGLQIMAVAHGGRLHQNVPDIEGLSIHRERPGEFVDHGATFIDGTLGARIFGSEPMVVNSSHHQAVADPGSLLVCARADDGSIEACEDPTATFVLGVQWHPEHPDRRSVDRRMLVAFVSAAEQFSGRR
ncbi:MAG TPA: gamma-glutamyl-gamma-aminobutyrate hydrolase [Actinobacteria bacterium]|jgi:putative glutamine amidotransferase|nr:gamma-glutamyl-gamma-aminobutyrate hydrolase [Actinomycetota bacterium]